MAVTENSYTGNGSTTNYSFTFPYLKATDIEVQVNASVVTNWSLANATTVQFNSAPSNGDKIKILRQTSVDELAATFYAGSAIKSEDLNDNYTQNLYKTQEVGNRFFSNTGGTMTGDLTMGEDTVLIFEGATDDAYETTLSVVDPTADRAVNLPNEDGTLIVSSSTTTVNVGSKDIHTTGHLELVDNGKIKLGANDDLQLYHNGVDSRINNRTGHLTIQNTSDNNDSNIYIKARDDDNSIICNDDGSVELYYDNNKKFETSNTGATITGTLVADDISLGDNDEVKLGDSDEIKIYYNGTNSFFDVKAGAGHLYLRNNTTGAGGNIYIQAQSGEQSVICNDSGSVELFHNDSKKFETTAAGATVTGTLTATVTGDVTGNASTATKLATARNIGGVAFDGTADIDIAGVNVAGNQNTTGNAATATALANARTIGGVSFDGTANINLPGVNTGGNQDTSGNAATATAATALATSRDFSATGEVTASAVGFTGAGNVALSTVIASNIVDEDNLKISNAGSDGQYLQKQSGNAGGLTWASPGGGTATAIATVNEATDTTCFPLFGTSATGDLQPKTNANLTFDSNTGALGTSLIKTSGALTIATTSLHLNNAADSEQCIHTTENGSVELFYDDNKKFETTANGITVGSHVWTTGGDYTVGNNAYIGDGGRIGFGASEDLKIYHDASHSYLDHNGTGNLYIRTVGTDEDITIQAEKDLYLKVAAGETAIKAIDTGAVELYYDDNKKFETTSWGTQITGALKTSGGGVSVLTDSEKLTLGAGDDLQIYHDGTDSWVKNTTGYLYLDSGASALRIISDSSWANGSMAAFYRDGSVEFYYDNAKKIETTSAGVTVTGEGDPAATLTSTPSQLIIHDDTDHNWDHNEHCGAIIFKKNSEVVSAITATHTRSGTGHGNEDGGISIWTSDSASTTVPKIRWEFDHEGNIKGNGGYIEINSEPDDRDEGKILLHPRGTAEDNDLIWIGTRDTDSSKYRFCVDGNGELRTNSAHFAGVQIDEANSPTNHFNTADRIRYSAFRGVTGNADYRARAIFGVASADWDDYRVLYYVDAQDDTAVDYDGDQTLSFSGSGRRQGMHNSWTGRVESDEASPNSVYRNSEGGFVAYGASDDYTLLYASTVADTSPIFESRVANEINVEIEADGSARTDGTWSDTNADYAECFEWTDGNASDQERRGMTVVLDGEKVKLATDSDNKDNIIGVVSPNPVVLGDAAPLGWKGRYKRDVYGSPILKEQEWLIWRREYHYKDGVKVLCDQPDPSKPQTLKEDIERVKVEDIEKQKAKNLIPAFAITNNIRYKTYSKDIDTTTYDPTKPYIPRQDRKEWDAIGMVGKLIVRRGQPVGTRWLLMKENIGTDTDGTVLDRYLVR